MLTIQRLLHLLLFFTKKIEKSFILFWNLKKLEQEAFESFNQAFATGPILVSFNLNLEP